MLTVSSPIVHAPFLLPLGPLTISGYGIAAAAALLLGYRAVTAEYQRLGIPARTLEDLILLPVVAGVISKVFAWTTGASALWDRGGFSLIGALIGLIPCVFWTARRRSLDVRQLADAMAVGFAALVPVGRTGCWAIGDDYGRPFDGPWAVVFPAGAPPSTAGTLAARYHEPTGALPPETLVAVHPAQLYELIGAVLIFAVIWRLRTRLRAGALSGVYLLAFGAARFLTEFLRAKSDRGVPGGLPTTQLIAAALALIGLGIFVRHSSGANADR